MKKLLAILLTAVLCLTAMFSLTGCAATEYDGTEGQGVTKEGDVYTIKVGNTAATTGNSASIGVPFNYGLQAALWQYEQTHTNIKFDFIHRNDEFTAEKAKTNTQQLVETDKVFALVGHFGTPTIEATADYIVEKGIPMVYAATGVSALYNNDAKGYERAIMSVQPIYNTEGRSMLATAVAPAPQGLAGKKVGVINTTDDAGLAMLKGIKEEAKVLGIKGIKYQSVDAGATDFAAAVNAVKRAGCDVVIVAAIQGPFSSIATQFVQSNYDNVSIITSYVSANDGTMSPLAAAGVMTETRKVYAGAWLDIIDDTANPLLFGFSAEYWAFATCMNLYDLTLNAQSAGSIYAANSFAMAGYIAGVTFTEGITRLLASGKDFTWLNYIEAMEEKGVAVPMTKGVELDFSNGQRLGITALSLSQYNKVVTKDEDNKDVITATGTVVRPLTTLAALEEAYNK